MTKIINARIENILGARKVEINFPSEGVTIGGENGQGKSSVLNAIIMTLAGKAKIPAEPVRRGEDEGLAEVTFEADGQTLVAKLKVDAERNTTLSIKSMDNKLKISKPRTLLAEIFSGISFDPGSFKLMTKQERLETLMKLAGVDFFEIERERERLYEERRVQKIVLAKEKAVYEQNAVDEEAAVEKIDTSAILKELEKINAAKSEYDRLDDRATSIRRNYDGLLADIDRLEKDIVRLQLELASKKKLTEQAKTELQETGIKIFNFDTSEFKSIPELQQKILDSQQANEKFNMLALKKAEQEARHAQIEQLENVVFNLNSSIIEIDYSKQQAIENAGLPIDGLSFEDGGVLYKGTAFEQLSESEQWEVSTAIGFALSKGSILIMSNSGGLDRRSRERIRQRAQSMGVQFLLEVVDDADDVEILIHEGKIADNRLEAL